MWLADCHIYHYFPNFLDGQVWANSEDPDQTAPTEAVWSGSTLFAIPSVFFGCISLRKRHLVQLLGDYSKFLCVRNFRIFKELWSWSIFKWMENMWAATWQNQQNESAPSEDSDQAGHLPSLIRVFAVCSRVAKDPSFLHVDSEDSDQTGRMPWLIWVFAGRTLILLVLSCCGLSFF